MTIESQIRWDLPALLHQVPGHKRFDAPLARYTSFRIGGPADALVQIDDIAALKQVQALACSHSIPLFVLGGGSNLLIRNGGIRGIVVVLRGVFRTYRVTRCAMLVQPGGSPYPVIKRGITYDYKGIVPAKLAGKLRCAAPATPATAFVHAGGGYPLSRLAMQLARQGWSGLEFAYGIPGTLGGAMVMNAGTHLGDLRQAMVAARLLLADGQECELPVEALGLRYRASAYPKGAIVLGGTMRIRREEPTTITAVMRQAYRRRQQTQPLWLPSAGSIFKNPPGVAAARWIDELGLKGTRIGGAMISPVHANFIVNLGHATAADIEALIALIRTRVQDAHGVTLELEVRVVGEEG